MHLHLARRGSLCCHQLSTGSAAVGRPYMYVRLCVSTHYTYLSSSSSSSRPPGSSPTHHVQRPASAWVYADTSSRARVALTAAVQSARSAVHACHVRHSAVSLSRRQLTAGAAFAAVTAGSNSWSWAAGAGGSRNSSSMAAAAAGTGSSVEAGDTGIIVVYVTAPSSEVGDSIATALVEQQLVACVNMLPGITSIYKWKGKVEKDSEVLLIMKTQAHLLDQLTSKVRELHPYEEPEVIGLPVVGGSDTYMQWVRDNTKA